MDPMDILWVLQIMCLYYTKFSKFSEFTDIQPVLYVFNGYFYKTIYTYSESKTILFYNNLHLTSESCMYNGQSMFCT